MSDVENLSARRADRATDSTEVTPLDMLRATAHDIATGKVEFDSLLIIGITRPDEGPWTYEVSRANLPRDQELVALTMCADSCIRRWKGDIK